MKEIKDHTHVQWMLDCEPRMAQLEAMSRSFYGTKVYDHKDDEPDPQVLREYRGQPMSGWGHFLEMRLGKTPLTLNEFMVMKYHEMVDNMIVIAPSSFRKDWAIEADKFGVDVPVEVMDAKYLGQMQRFVKKNKNGVFVAHYESAQHDHLMQIIVDYAHSGTMMVFDESIKIKNRKSVPWEEFKEVANKCGPVRLLSGKPIVQEPADIYAQLRMMGKLNGTNYYSFRGHYQEMVRRPGPVKALQMVGTKNENELTTLIEDNGFVARRKNWRHTSEPEFRVQEIELNEKQKKMYRQMDQEYYIDLEDGDYVEADFVITKLMKLQQISSGFIYDAEGVGRQLVGPKANPKVQFLVDMLQNQVNGKMIVIAHYTETIKMLTEFLKKFNPALIAKHDADGVTMDGEMIIEHKRRFNEDPKCRLIIGQAEKTKYGHTLIGTETDTCDNLVFFENTFNLDTRIQCEQRPQGVWKNNNIMITDFQSSPIEKRAVEALQKKLSIADMILHRDRPDD